MIAPEAYRDSTKSVSRLFINIILEMTEQSCSSAKVTFKPLVFF